MTNGSDVRDVLDRVVREEATAVGVDARAAWQEGRRRRARNRIAAAGAAVLVVGIGLASLNVVQDRPAIWASGGAADVADKHPQRLDFVYWDDDQPSVTGPLAGLVQRNGDGTSGWYSVSPEGHLWRLDTDNDTVPSLSPDGTHLGYLRGGYEDGTYVITNQVDGSEVTFPQIGTGVDASDSPYFHSAQAPSFWSPDGSAVLVRIGKMDLDAPGQEPAAALLGTDGTFTIVPVPEGAGADATPVGWLNDDRVVLISGPGRQGQVHAWIVDVDKGLWHRDFALETGAAHYRETYQWFGTAEGRLLATATEDQVRYFALEPPLEGRVYATTTGVPHAADTCPATWADGLYVPAATDRDSGDSAILVRANGGTTILADPRLDIVCSIWARTAIEGPAHRSWGTRLFDQDSSWISWHWREVTLSALSLVLLIAAGTGVLWRRRARRKDM